MKLTIIEHANKQKCFFIIGHREYKPKSGVWIMWDEIGT